jgi:hypothetical protein
MLLRLILTLTIFLPTLAVYAHELSHHQHQDCENTVVHLHEYENDCYLDDFISNKIYTYSTNIYESLVFLFDSEIFVIEVLNLKRIQLDFFKRGPPSN